MHLKSIFLVGLLAISAISHAELKFNSAQDEAIYFETKQLCQQAHGLIDVIVNKNNLNAFLVSTGENLMLLSGGDHSTDVMQKQLEQKTVSDYAWDRMGSEGFQQAISECFPDREDMQSAFYYSMIVSDTLGKVPTIVAFIYIGKVFKYVSAGLSTKFPKIMKAVNIAALTSMALYAVLVARAFLKGENSDLTKEEKARVEQIKENMEDNIDQSKKLVFEIANETIVRLEHAYLETTDPEKRKEIKSHINKINRALEKI